MQSDGIRAALARKATTLRTKAGLSHGELASLLSETPAAVRHRENNLNTFSTQKLEVFLAVVSANSDEKVEAWKLFFLIARHPRRDAERMAQAKVLGVVAA